MERRQLVDLGRLGTIDQFQFARLGLGLMLALMAFALGSLALEAMRELLAGREPDHPVARTMVGLVAVFCTVLAVRLIGRTVLQIRLTRTGVRARGTIVSVETRDNVRWKNRYRFHDAQGNPREGVFDTRTPEWVVGDEGDVFHADNWAGSRWMSESIRSLPPPPRPSLAQGLAKMALFLFAASMLIATGVLLSIAGWVSNVLDYHGLVKGGFMLAGVWLLITAFALPFVAILGLLFGPFIAAAYAIVQEAFSD